MMSSPVRGKTVSQSYRGTLTWCSKHFSRQSFKGCSILFSSGLRSQPVLTVSPSSPTDQHAHHPQTRLDISLEGDVQRYIELGLASATRKTYQPCISRFYQFCTMYSVSDPLSASQSLLCSFVSYLANAGLACTTIRTYVSAIRHLQISRDLPEPRATPMPKLALVERGIQNARAANRANRPRLPITPTILRKIKDAWTDQASHFDTVMFWAVCCTAFFSFFRMGEITAQSIRGNGDHWIQLKDIAIDNHTNQTVIKLHVRSSKTDQPGKGVDVLL